MPPDLAHIFLDHPASTVCPFPATPRVASLFPNWLDVGRRFARVDRFEHHIAAVLLEVVEQFGKGVASVTKVRYALNFANGRRSRAPPG